MRSKTWSMVLAGWTAVVIQTAAHGTTSEVARTGWWQRANAIGLPGSPSLPAVPPVPEGGLYVARDVAGESALSALHVNGLDARRANLTLLLTDESSLPLGATIHACPTTSAWTARANGPWSDRPTYDCSTAAVVGEIDDGSSSIVWRIQDTRPFGGPDALDLVIVPAATDDKVYAVAFEPLDPDSVERRSERPDTGPVEPSPNPGPPATAPSRPTYALPSAETLPLYPALTPTIELTTEPPERPAVNVVSRRRLPEPVALPTDGGVRAVLVALLSLGAGGVWWRSQRRIAEGVE